MVKNYKSNHAIGCAMRQFKKFGFGEPNVAAKKTTFTASIFEKQTVSTPGLVYARVSEFNSEENIFIHLPVHRDSLSELDKDYN